MINILSILFLTAQVPFVDLPSTPVATGNSLSANLIAYYKFDEASGNAQDSSGGNFHLTQTGTSSSTTGLIATSRAIGNTTRFSTGDHANFEVDTGPYTIMFWVNFASLPIEGQQSIVSKYDYGLNGSYKIGTLKAGSYVAFEFAIMTSDESGYSLQVPTAITINTWYCICARINPTAEYFYLDVRAVNGSWLPDLSNYSGAILNSATSLVVNGVLDSSLVLQEKLNTGTRIDELAFWRRSLTDCERDKYFNLGLGLPLVNFNTLPCQ